VLSCAIVIPVPCEMGSSTEYTEVPPMPVVKTYRKTSATFSHLRRWDQLRGSSGWAEGLGTRMMPFDCVSTRWTDPGGRMASVWMAVLSAML
jgi:hypothetical protein